MAGYNTIRGLRVKYLSSDPATSEEGQVWYNSFTGNLRLNGFVLSAFSSGGNRNDGQNDGCGAGTLTAGLAFGGGRNPNSPSSGGLPTQKQSEEYNGSSWAEGGAMSTGRVTFGGFGTQTAALAFGGRITNNTFTYTNATEEYGGSSWTSGGNLGSTAYYMSRSGGGTQTAGVSVGGINNIPGTSNDKRTEEYNGSTWTTVNNMLANSRRTVYLGTQTAGLIASGGPPAPGNNSAFNYDGTNWTAAGVGTVNALSGRVGIGTASAGLLMSGTVPFTQGQNSELWNGTAFANDAITATQRSDGQSSSASTTDAGYVTGGGNPTTPGTALTSTEEYTATIATKLNVTTS